MNICANQDMFDLKKTQKTRHDRYRDAGFVFKRFMEKDHSRRLVGFEIKEMEQTEDLNSLM